MSRGGNSSGPTRARLGFGFGFGFGLRRRPFGLGLGGPPPPPPAGGFLFGLQRGLQLAEVFRLFDHLGLVGIFSRFAYAMDDDGESRHEVDRQAQPRRMDAEGLDRFAVDLAPVGGETGSRWIASASMAVVIEP